MGEAMPLLKQVAGQIRKHSMIASGDTVVAGVSGGPDSVALVHILYRLREQFTFRLVVAHLNHGFRGSEAEADARFVADLAGRLQLECYIEKRDVPGYCARTGLSAQAAAREIRYSFLSEVATKTGASRVALGHHAGDQAETILLHLLRGSGPGGLGGMSPVRDGFYIRPLLTVSREDIESYCRHHNLPTRRDSSNFQVKYLRNRVRLELIPLLEKNYNPGLEETLNRLGEICREENEYLDKHAREALRRARVGPVENGVALDRKQLLSLPRAILRRLVRMAWSEVCGSKEDLEFNHVNQILEIIKEEKGLQQVDLPRNITCVKSYDLVQFTVGKEKKEIPFYQYQLKVPGITVIPEAGVSIGARIVPPAWAGDPASLSPDEALMDYDLLKMPLVVRRRLQGDRFAPLGLGGTMKLKKFFIDRKIPRHLRDCIPLVVSGNDIVWVAGIRPGEKWKITGATSTCLHLFIHDYRESFCDKLIRGRII